VTRKVDVRLPEKGDAKSHGASPVHLIITMIMWIRTRRLSVETGECLLEGLLATLYMQSVARSTRSTAPSTCRARLAYREFFIGILLVRIHIIIEMIRRTGLAPWEFEFPLPGSLTFTFLRVSICRACCVIEHAGEQPCVRCHTTDHHGRTNCPILAFKILWRKQTESVFFGAISPRN